MKKIDDYLKLNYRIEVVKDELEDGYVISIPQLKGCITTAETIEEGMMMIEDAKKEWLKVAIEDGLDIPKPVDVNNFSGQFKLRMPKTLHKELMGKSKMEGISMNQYCVYLLSKNLSSSVDHHNRSAS